MGDGEKLFPFFDAHEGNCGVLRGNLNVDIWRKTGENTWQKSPCFKDFFEIWS